MKKTQLKDALRNIWKQKVSYLSILVIAMLAVMAYLGINFASRAIANNGNAFYDETRFRDIEIISTKLLTADDMAAIRAIPGVADAESVWNTSGKLLFGESRTSVNVVSLTQRVNVPMLLEGSLPETADECALEQTIAEELGIRVGDAVFLQSPKGETAEFLGHTDFKVTGIVFHPDHGCLTLMVPGSREVVVLPEAFELGEDLQGCCMKAELLLDKTAGTDRFGKQYLASVQTVMKSLETLSAERTVLRDAEIRAMYTERIDEGRTELDEAAAKLSDARKQLDDGAAEIAENQKKLDDAVTELREALDALTDGETELADNQKKLDDAAAALQTARTQLNDGKWQLNSAKAELDDGERQLAEGKVELDAAAATLAEKKAELDDGERQLAEAKAELDDGERQLAEAKTQLDDGERQLAAAKAELDDGEQKLTAAKAELDDGERQLAEGKAELDEKKKELDEARQTLDAAAEELAAGKAELKRSAALLMAAKVQLNEAEPKLAEGEKQLRDGEKQLAEADRELTEGEKQLKAAAAEIAAGEAQLAEAKTQLRDGYAQIEEGKEAVREGVRSGLKTGIKSVVPSDYLTDDDVDTAIGLIPWSSPGGPPNLGDASIDATWFQLTEHIGFRLVQLGSPVDMVMTYFNTLYSAVASRLPEQAQAYAEAGRDAAEAELRSRLAMVEWITGIYNDAVAQMEAWNEGRAQYQEGLTKLNAGKADYAKGKAEYDDGLADYRNGRQRLEAAREEYEKALAEYNDGKARYTEGLAQYDEGKARYESGLAEYEDGERQYADGLARWNEGKAQYEAFLAEYEDGKARYTEGLAQYEDGKARYTEGLAEYNKNKAQYDDALTRFNDGKAAYESGLAQLEEGKARYAEGLAQYEAGMAEYEQSLAQWNDGLAQYLSAKDRYDASEQEYLDGVRRYEDGVRALEEGRQKIEEGRTEYEKGLADYDDGKRQLDAGRETLKEKEAEYADGEKQLAEGEEQLDSARAEMESQDPTRWVVLDAQGNASYVTIRNGSKNVADMGATFALVFVLVGALVIYATVGRIVDEQRRQVGATKALGLFNREIFLKYLCFGVTAAFFGVIAGTALGYVGIQRILTMVYGRYYVFGVKKLAFLPGLTLIALLLAVALTGLTVWSACKELLKSTAIRLMQEKAPPSKYGARGNSALPLYWRAVLLNMRMDKKRVAVTIVSVAGCCTLLVAGFSMRSSVMSALNRQFEETAVYDAKIKWEPGVNPDAGGEIGEALRAAGTDWVALYDRELTWSADGSLNSAELLCAPLAELDDYFVRRDPKTGKPLGDLDGVWISKGVSKTAGLGAGDTIILYDAVMNPYPARVAGVYNEYAGREMILSTAYYTALFGAAPENNAFLVHFNGADPAELRASVGAISGIGAFDEIAQLLATYQSYAAVLNLIAGVLTLVAALMAYFILLNLASMYVNQKKRELTIMRVNGFTVKEVIRYVAGESIATTAIGIALGLGLGTLLTSRVLTLLEGDSLQLLHNVQWSGWLLGALITVVFSVVIYAVALRKVKYLKLTDVA